MAPKSSYSMRFTRINENTVNCIITAEDMDEQGLSIEDLFRKKDEAMAFLREIIARAAEEVDYRPSGSYLPMQIAVLPDRAISLTLSEDANAAVSDMLRGLTERIREFLEKVLPEELKQQIKEGIEDARMNEEQQKRLPGPVRYSEYVFSFDTIRTAAEFADTLPGELGCESMLYKSGDGRFYLRFRIKEEDPKAFAAIFMRASEYGAFESVEERQILHMEESMECLIESEAMQTLRRL